MSIKFIPKYKTQRNEPQGRHFRRAGLLSSSALAMALLALGAPQAGAQEAAREYGTFKLLAFNTWGTSRFTQQYPLYTEGNFDVMALSEVNGSFASRLAAELGADGHGTYGYSNTGDKAVISRLTGAYWDNSSTGGYMIDPSSGISNPVMILDAQEGIPQTAISSIHLNYWDDPKDYRVAQAKSLAAWAQGADIPLIIAGDFNGGDISERGLGSEEYGFDYPVDYENNTNIPLTLNILKHEYQLIQSEDTRELFEPAELGNQRYTWPSALEDDEVAKWPTWQRVRIDHIMASRPFAKWYVIADREGDNYTGVIQDEAVFTDGGGNTQAMSDHAPVAHTLKWVGPVLENYDQDADDASQFKTRVIWGEDATLFEENGGEFLLTRNNMRNDVYLGQVADENGQPILTELTLEEKKTLLDCATTDSRFQQAVQDYCIDDHTFINEVLVTDGGTVVVTEDAAMGLSQADLHLDDGALRIDGTDMPTLSRQVVFESGGGALVVSDAAATVGALGAFSGTGNFTKDGAGTLVLAADSAGFTSATEIAGGALYLTQEARLGGTVKALSGTTFGGLGSVGATTIMAGATHAPGGDGASVQTIAGDYVNHGTLLINATPTTADRVAVEGSVDIADALLRLSLTPTVSDGWSPLNGPLTLIDNRGSAAVAGSFGDIEHSLLFLDATLDYQGQDGNDVDLYLARNDIAFGAHTDTANQKAVAEAVEALGTQSELWNAIAVSEDEALLKQSFDSLSGEIHASVQTVMMDYGRMLQDGPMGRLRSATGLETRGTGDPIVTASIGDVEHPALLTTVWSHAYGSWTDWNGTAGTADLDSSLGGLSIGADMPVGEWTLGAYGGFGTGNIAADERASRTNMNSAHIGLYGGREWGQLAFRSGAALGWHEVSTERTAFYGAEVERLDSETNAYSGSLFGELAYTLEAGSGRFEPFANLTHVTLHGDDFAESRGAAALAVNGWDSNVTFSTLGINVARDFSIGSATGTGRAMIGWRHAFGDVDPSASVAFAGGEAFTIAGTPLAENLAVLELGLDVSSGKNATFGVSYTGQFGEDVADHGVNVQFKMTF